MTVRVDDGIEFVVHVEVDVWFDHYDARDLKIFKMKLYSITVSTPH